MPEKQEKRKILYISGSRADYGLMKKTLETIKNNPRLELAIVATGMHLMPEFGETIQEIRKDGFSPITAQAFYQQDNKPSMVLFLAEFIKEFTKIAIKEVPDFILLLGDRPEMLGGAITGSYLSIPVCHIHGGDKTLTVDEFARHAITKLAHLHFPATRLSAQRIAKMGEEKWRIFIVGAPGLDRISKQKLLNKKEFCQKFGLPSEKPFALVIQHPVSEQARIAGWQMKETLQAITEMDLPAIVIYPNADAGGRKIIKIIEQYCQKNKLIKCFKNLVRIDYLSAMKNAGVIAGNSSSGIIESGFFHLPAINIGERQKDRERGANIIDASHQKENIKKALRKALFDEKFRQKIKSFANPYQTEQTSQKIAKILAQIKITPELLAKQITY